MSAFATWSVEMTSEFPMGAGIQLRSPEPGRITFMAPWDGSPQPLWFNFLVKGTLRRRVRFDLLNAGHCLGGPDGYRQNFVYPVYTTDPPELAPSKRNWKRVAPGDISYRDGVCSFEIDIAADMVTVAHCYPYGLAELDELMEDHHGSPLLKRDDFCKSKMGNILPRLSIGKGRAKPFVWLTARHHAGEAGGSWALDGLIRWLLGGDPEAEWLLERYRFHAFPFMDIDGVLSGWYGKERAPLDFNRAWIEDSPRQEVASVMKEVIDPGHQGAAFLDFHCPGAGDPHQLYFPTPLAVSRPQMEFCKFFGESLLSGSPEGARLSSEDVCSPTYMGHEEATTCGGFASMSKGIPGLGIEVSYGRLREAGSVMTRESYRKYGAAVGRSLARTLKRFPGASSKGGETPFHDARPFEEYSGKAFKGCFTWGPPSLASLACEGEGRTETLLVETSSGKSMVNLSLPPVPSSGKVSYSLEMSLDGEPPRLEWTFFWLSASGLQFRWNAKAATELRPSAEPVKLSFELDPPPKARYIQANLRISGGPCRLRLSPGSVFKP